MNSIIHDTQHILRSFKMSLDFNKLISAFVGIVLSIFWVLVMLAFGSAFKLVELTPFELINSFLISPGFGLCSFFKVFVSSIKTVEAGEYAVLLILVLGLLVIWSVFAGSITRMTAVEFAHGKKIGFKNAFSFALKKFWSYFWSPLAPILGVLFFIACNVIGGLLGKIEFAGEIAVAVGFPLALLSGLLIVFLGFIGTIGFFLMFPTISAEGSDAFDAISRSYSYVISRPLHFLVLFVSIIVCGIIMSFIAGCGACMVVKTTYWTVGIGMGDKLDNIRAFIAGLSGAETTIASLNPISMRIAALLFMLYIVLIKITVGSIVTVFAGAASTIAYLILRNDVDGTAMDDVYMEEGEEEAEITKYNENRIQNRAAEKEANTEGFKETEVSDAEREIVKEQDQPGSTTPEDPASDQQESATNEHETTEESSGNNEPSHKSKE